MAAKMSTDLPPVTEMELAVLRILWEKGPTTIRHISDRIYPGGRASHYATVQKLLERLEHKQCIRRDRSQRAHQFEAIVSRDHFLGDQLRELAEKVCSGSFAPLLSSLVGSKRWTSEERESLQELLDDANRKRTKKPRRSQS